MNDILRSKKYLGQKKLWINFKSLKMKHFALGWACNLNDYLLDFLMKNVKL